MKRFFLLLLIGLSSAIFFGCQDLPPTEYIPKNYVQAFLYVGEPISNIVVMRSTPINDSLNYDSYLIKDAEVKITYNNKTLNLTYSDSGVKGYSYIDSNELVKPNTLYSLEVRLKDGTVMTARTFTPDMISWLKPPPDIVYYPKDTVNLPPVDSLYIKWTASPIDSLLKLYYFVCVKCLDTLQYGKYLTPPTSEMNRRIGKIRETASLTYREVETWNPIPVTKTPIVWGAFKWYGLNEAIIYAPDYNFTRWMIQYLRFNSANTLFSSIDNGFGVFGSASRISKIAFLVKNQP